MGSLWIPLPILEWRNFCKHKYESQEKNQFEDREKVRLNFGLVKKRCCYPPGIGSMQCNSERSTGCKRDSGGSYTEVIVQVLKLSEEKMQSEVQERIMRNAFIKETRRVSCSYSKPFQYHLRCFFEVTALSQPSVINEFPDIISGKRLN